MRFLRGGATQNLKTRPHKVFKLFGCRHGFCLNLPLARNNLLALTFYNRLVNLTFILEISVNRAPPFVRGVGDVKHGRVLHPFSDEELTGHLDKAFSCLAYHAAVSVRDGKKYL